MSFAFAPDDVAPLPLEQKIAIMESFMIAVVADGDMPHREAQQFDREVQAIDWGLEPDELLQHMTEARKRVLALRDPNEAVALIVSVTARVSGVALREKVFRSMGAIMFADADMATKELAVLAGYAKLFALSDERYEAIKADIIAAARG